MFRSVPRFALLWVLFLALVVPSSLRAQVPWPAPDPGVDSDSYHEYLFLDRAATPGTPDDYTGATWRYSRLQDDELAGDSEELNGVKGMSIDTAWTRSTGRPDVVTAILDSGIRWEEADVRKQAALNRNELPLPDGSSVYDANGDGFFNVEDYAGDPRVSDANGNGILDAEDLILTFGDGVDDDNNGYTDDISGWNFLDDTNNPFDEVDHSHGTSMAKNATAEAANGSGFPGVCPNCQFLPLRVGESFIHHSVDYARAVTYAVNRDVSLIQGSLGAVDVTRSARRATQYAWDRGVPLVLAQNDEASQHHNYPASLRYTIPVNAIQRAGTSEDSFDGLLDPSYLYVVGCSGFGSQNWVSVSDTGCSSGATSLTGGVVALLQSHARNQVDRGIIQPHPDRSEWPSDNVLSPAEVRGLLQQSADDVNIGPDTAGVFGGITTKRYPTRSGWDPYTGSGRINAARLLNRVRPDSIPPEVVLDDPRRWAPVTPETPLEVSGTVRPWRNPDGARYELQIGCTNNPSSWSTLEEGPIDGSEKTVSWVLVWPHVMEHCPNLGTKAAIGPGNLAKPLESRSYMMLRLTVVDGKGNRASDRRTILGHDDPALKSDWPRDFGTSLSPPLFVDLNGDHRRELVTASASGKIHALRSNGSNLSGWPVTTDPHPAASRRNLADELGLPGPIRMSLNGVGPRIADLEGDGDLEVVAATLQGRVFAWHHNGKRLDGFPVSIDFSFSRPAIRDRINTLIPGIFTAPLPVDLNDNGDKEIVVAAMDRHVYAWHHDGSPVAGYPTVLADRSKVDVDPTDHTVSPNASTDADSINRGAQINSVPVACDVNGDDRKEILVGTSESYRERMNVSLQSLPDRSGLGGFVFGGGQGTSNGRLYALKPNTDLLSDSWPIRVPITIGRSPLPYVGEGIQAKPECFDVDGDGTEETAVNSFLGPTMLYEASGKSHFGTEADLVSDNTVDSAPIPFSLQPGDSGVGTDTPYMGFSGMPSVGHHDTRPAVVGTQVGMLRVIDFVLPGHQIGGQDQVAVWHGRTGQPFPASPLPVEDFQFYNRQALTNVGGSGHEDVVALSSGGSLHAWNPRTGDERAGFPKTTGHWMLGTPGVDDMDDDGREELAAAGRDGWLWAWNLDPLAFVEYLDTGPATLSDTVTLTNRHLGDTRGKRGPLEFQAGLPAVEIQLAIAGCASPPAGPPEFQVASLGPDHPRTRRASTGGFAVDVEPGSPGVDADCVSLTIDRKDAGSGRYVPVRYDPDAGVWGQISEDRVLSRQGARIRFRPRSFSSFAVVPAPSDDDGGSSCLVERTGLPRSVLARLRAGRDVLLNHPVGRWLTRIYYTLPGLR